MPGRQSSYHRVHLQSVPLYKFHSYLRGAPSALSRSGLHRSLSSSASGTFLWFHLLKSSLVLSRSHPLFWCNRYQPDYLYPRYNLQIPLKLFHLPEAPPVAEHHSRHPAQVFLVFLLFPPSVQATGCQPEQNPEHILLHFPVPLLPQSE